MIRLGGTILKAALALALAFAVTSHGASAQTLSPNGERVAHYAGASVAAINAAPALAAHVNQLTGELYANAQLGALGGQREFRRALPTAMDYTHNAHMFLADAGVASYDAFAAYCGPGDCGSEVCASKKGWILWDTPYMEWTDRKNRNGHSGFEVDTSGFATGVTKLFDCGFSLGLAVGYDHRNLDMHRLYAKNESDTLNTALYAGMQIGSCFFIDVYGGWTRNWNWSDRYLLDAGGAVIGHAKGSYNDNVWSAGAKFTYVWHLPKDFLLISAIGIDYSYVDVDGINEYGSAHALRVNDNHLSAWQMPITVAFNRTFQSQFLAFGGKCSLWTPEIRGGWVPQFGKDRASVNARPAAAAAPGFASRSVEQSDSYGTVGAGVKLQLNQKYIFALNYDFDFAKKYSSHNLTATYGMSF